MKNYQIITSLISLALTILWGVYLWKFSRSRKTTGKRNFYLLFYLPLAIPLLISILSFTIFGGIISLVSSGIVGMLWGLVVLALVIFYFILWGLTLYEVGATKRPVWFILILLISPLWIFYQTVQLIK